ncbi:Tumor necrosis factor ligand superfamily member 12 [Vulpes lagopus]
MSSGSFPVPGTEVLSLVQPRNSEPASALSRRPEHLGPEPHVAGWAQGATGPIGGAGGPATSPPPAPSAPEPGWGPRCPAAPLHRHHNRARVPPSAHPGPEGLLQGSARGAHSAAPPPRSVRLPAPSPPGRPSPLPPGRPPRPPAPPAPRGSRAVGGAARQAQPPAPMAARRSQRRRGRRGEPGTALLAPLALGLGLALACLGLLLAAVSLGSRASAPAQEPSQGELVADEDPDPPELNSQTEESQDPGPFLKRLVRTRRNASKGRKTRARRAIAAHYEVHPQPGQDGGQAGKKLEPARWPTQGVA